MLSNYMLYLYPKNVGNIYSMKTTSTHLYVPEEPTVHVNIVENCLVEKPFHVNTEANSTVINTDMNSPQSEKNMKITKKI